MELPAELAADGHGVGKQVALLAERGVQVSYETVRRWVAKFGTYYVEELRKRERRAGRTWHLDETATRVGGRLHWLWRAVNEHGATLDVLRQERRDTDAAERFFRRLLGRAGNVPERITTDKLGSYAAALRQFPELAGAEHLRVRSAQRCNNRVEQAHQPTRLRERVTRRFRSAASARPFLEAFARVADLFRPHRHLLTAAAYRATMRERATLWRDVAGLRAAERYDPRERPGRVASARPMNASATST